MRMVVIDMVSWFCKDRPMDNRSGKRADDQAEDPDGAIARAIAKTAKELLLRREAWRSLCFGPAVRNRGSIPGCR